LTLTIERVRRYYFWPGLVPDVKAYINDYEVCKTTKAPKYDMITSGSTYSLLRRGVFVVATE